MKKRFGLFAQEIRLQRMPTTAGKLSNGQAFKAGIIVEAFNSLAPAKLALSGFPSMSLASPPLRCANRLASATTSSNFR